MPPIKIAIATLTLMAAAPLTPAGATTFSYTGGFQTFDAPVAGIYLIQADGARGGSGEHGNGGAGAQASGLFNLAANEAVSRLVAWAAVTSSAAAHT